MLNPDTVLKKKSGAALWVEEYCQIRSLLKAGRFYRPSVVHRGCNCSFLRSGAPLKSPHSFFFSRFSYSILLFICSLFALPLPFLVPYVRFREHSWLQDITNESFNAQGGLQGKEPGVKNIVIFEPQNIILCPFTHCITVQKPASYSLTTCNPV